MRRRSGDRGLATFIIPGFLDRFPGRSSTGRLPSPASPFASTTRPLAGYLYAGIGGAAATASPDGLAGRLHPYVGGRTTTASKVV